MEVMTSYYSTVEEDFTIANGYSAIIPLMIDTTYYPFDESTTNVDDMSDYDIDVASNGYIIGSTDVTATLEFTGAESS
jgi:hypothetical protein